MATTSSSLTTTGSVTLTLGTGGANDTHAVVVLSGTYGTVTGVVEGSSDGGSNYYGLAALARQTNVWATGTIAPADNAEVAYLADVMGCTHVRFRCTAIASGTLGVAIASGSYPFSPLAIPAGATAVASSDLQLNDDVDLALGTDSDALVRFSTGDASNPATVIALDDTSQHLHVTDKGAVATDWNLSAGTHPTVHIHSNTTPATDYLKIGAHDGTTAELDVVGGTTLALKIAGTQYAGVVATGLHCGTYVAAGSAAGTDQLTLKSTGTAPSGTGANVGHLFADFETDDDELFWLSGTNGTSTQLTT